VLAEEVAAYDDVLLVVCHMSVGCDGENFLNSFLIVRSVLVTKTICSLLAMLATVFDGSYLSSLLRKEHMLKIGWNFVFTHGSRGKRLRL